MTTVAPAIELRGLRVRIDTTEILRGVDLVLERGSMLGVVGQSGSGKSMTARALAGLLPPGATTSGEYLLAGRPVELAGRESSWRRLRGAHVVWLPQDPFTSLDPLRRCGEQVLAGLSAPSSRARQVRLTEAERRLREVGLPPGVARAYPHQLSGGMRQRVAIAAALAPDPEVLIADEPTTALDVTTQAGILDLLDRLRRERGLSMVLITHDLLLARERCDHLAVFHDGRAVESGPTERIVTAAEHAVTRELVAAGLAGPIHRGDDRDTPGVLVARGISKTYPGADRPALVGADLEVAAGEIVGVVGESGSGKTTLSRCLVGLERPDHGQFGYLDLDGRPQPWSPSQAQLVFQNPYASLNPSMSVRSTLVEALRSSGRSAGELPGLLELVGLDPALAGRRPARLSGGERQRVAIARALAPRPRVLFCDEAVSALDAPIQARILRMLAELRDRLGLAIVFVTHDLGVVRQLAQRIYVMRAGRIVETGLTEQVLDHPRHDYTRELLASLPGVRPAPDLEPHRQEAAHVRGA